MTTKTNRTCPDLRAAIKFSLVTQILIVILAGFVADGGAAGQIAFFAFVIALVKGAIAHRVALDERIGDAAKNWRVERMAVLDRLVMQLAVEEMMSHRDSPPRVVISEAIELARSYSGEEAAKFVNGVLDGVFRKLKDEGLVAE